MTTSEPSSNRMQLMSGVPSLRLAPVKALYEVQG